MNTKWDQFAVSGKILDYLNYKEIDIKSVSNCSTAARVEGEKAHAVNDRGSCHS